MSVRAKFRVAEKEDSQWQGYNPGDVFRIKLYPVVGGSEENDAFYQATTGGQIVLATVNGQAAAAFEVGKSYYVDFTPADG